MPVKLKRLWVQITADRKKAGILSGCLLIGMLLWARLIVIARMPRHAVADPLEVQVDEPLEDAASGPTPRRDKPPITIKLDTTFERDPFIISMLHFPKPTPTTESGPEAGKFSAEAVEDDGQANVRMQLLLQSVVSRFRLDAVMTGSPIAVINGNTYRLGEQIPAVDQEQLHFDLLEVRDRSIVLGYEDFRFELNIEQL